MAGRNYHAQRSDRPQPGRSHPARTPAAATHERNERRGAPNQQHRKKQKQRKKARQQAERWEQERREQESRGWEFEQRQRLTNLSPSFMANIPNDIHTRATAPPAPASFMAVSSIGDPDDDEEQGMQGREQEREESAVVSGRGEVWVKEEKNGNGVVGVGGLVKEEDEDDVKVKVEWE